MEKDIIIQKRRRLLYKLSEIAKLNGITSSYEAKYGTGSTPPATAQFTDPYASANTDTSGMFTGASPSVSTLTGVPAGGVVGSVAGQKQQDINTEAQNFVNIGQTPNVVPA